MRVWEFESPCAYADSNNALVSLTAKVRFCNPVSRVQLLLEALRKKRGKGLFMYECWQCLRHFIGAEILIDHLNTDHRPVEDDLWRYARTAATRT